MTRVPDASHDDAWPRDVRSLAVLPLIGFSFLAVLTCCISTALFVHRDIEGRPKHEVMTEVDAIVSRAIALHRRHTPLLDALADLVNEKGGFEIRSGILELAARRGWNQRRIQEAQEALNGVLPHDATHMWSADDGVRMEIGVVSFDGLASKSVLITLIRRETGPMQPHGRPRHVEFRARRTFGQWHLGDWWVIEVLHGPS